MPGDGRGRAGGSGLSGALYRRAVLAFGVVAILLGVALLVETALAGGGVGYLFGVLFVAAGSGRLYLLRRR